MALQFYDENIPCLAACPVHTNAGAYVAAIADGDDLGAYLTARMPNPFASVCGRVCAAPCEDACRRGEIDQPIAIRALKRFVTEKYGVEGGGEDWRQVAAPKPVDRPESIGIVGGGPAGMACAHDLRLQGYRVTVYEATSQLGGMMKLGIPEYRLNRDLLGAELNAIVDLGVEVRLNTKLGDDISFGELRARHDALFLAHGASLGRGLDIEGHQADGVLKAIEFLINVNQGFEVEVGDRVIVIGGGDVAMDAARTALRREDYDAARGAQSPADEDRSLVEALDAARSAARSGAAEVTVISLEAEDQMPASPFELEEAQAEDIKFVHSRGPARILEQNGAVVGLETIGVLSVFDEDGRFAPQFDPDDLEVFDADTVILAVGQAVDVSALAGTVDLSPRGTIGVNDSLATSLEGVWAGGDASHGPRTLILAIADGRKVASAIHEYFTGETPHDQKGQLVELEQFHRFDDTYDRWDRLDVPVIATDRRVGLAEVELGFTEQQARCEAARCLRCFANIELDVNKCVLCALCSDVCPLDLIALVPAEEVGGSVGHTALTLDERACIRCGLCIERCPPRALSMALWTGVGVPALTGGPSK
jgi:NADPH-dependent glutamate synthase beta subunit-like oxidoreductase